MIARPMILPLILALNAHPDLGRQLAAARDSLAKCSHAHVEGRVLTPLRHRGGVIPKSVSRKHADAKSVSYPEKVAGRMVLSNTPRHAPPPSGIPSSSGIVAAHGSLPAVLGSFPSAVPPPSGFTLPQGSHGETENDEQRERDNGDLSFVRPFDLSALQRRDGSGALPRDGARRNNERSAPMDARMPMRGLRGENTYWSRHPGVACLTKAAAAFGVGYLIGSFGEDHDTRTVFVVPQHDGDGDDDDDDHHEEQ